MVCLFCQKSSFFIGTFGKNCCWKRGPHGPMAQIVPGVRPSCPMSACVPVASDQTPTLAVDFMGKTKEDWRDWRSGETGDLESCFLWFSWFILILYIALLRFDVIVVRSKFSKDPHDEPSINDKPHIEPSSLRRFHEWNRQIRRWPEGWWICTNKRTSNTSQSWVMHGYIISLFITVQHSGRVDSIYPWENRLTNILVSFVWSIGHWIWFKMVQVHIQSILVYSDDASLFVMPERCDWILNLSRWKIRSISSITF